MKKLLMLICITFSSFTFSAGMSGGSTVTVPQIICMQNGEILGTTAMPVYECGKLKKEQTEKTK
ncbi:hypothetical protein L4D09_09270 [Photobacterium makurazakiensis]|uniref:hypothetical protein n=1 Tax=Photobacterium makurazakiensis TaxID=2910234 RepID=UPI003D0BC373